MKQNEKILHSEEEKHTAMGSIAGYAFQFYFFLYKLLTMEHGSIVSFEKLDDTATEKDQAITFFQVKHTVQQAALEGKDRALTNRASDLWKALDVWRKLITVKNGNIRSDEEQKVYIDTHDFVIVCNKNHQNNKLANLCNKIRIEEISNDEIDKVFDEITGEAKNNRTKNNGDRIAQKPVVQVQIDALRDFKYRANFLSKVKFESLNFDNIKEECLNHIRNNLRFPENQKQDVFDDFMLEVMKDFTECTKVGKPLSYDYEKQLNRFEAVFKNKRTESLNFRVKIESFKKEFLDLVCIRQLAKVDDIKLKDLDKIAKYSSYFFSFKNRFNELNDDFKITEPESIDFWAEVNAVWDNHFSSAYADVDEHAEEQEISRRARMLLKEIRSFKVTLCKEQLSIPISNGAFYYFSDECKIGWHREWENLFKKDQ